jgi:hypothetical protein
MLLLNAEQLLIYIISSLPVLFSRHSFINLCSLENSSEQLVKELETPEAKTVMSLNSKFVKYCLNEEPISPLPITLIIKYSLKN